jgi:hypothetical protein
MEPMPVVYADPSITKLPDAASRLRQLVDDGWSLVLLAPVDVDLVPDLGIATTVASLPESPERGSWLLTAEPGVCAERRPGLRSLLVGPTAPTGGRRQPRCDAEARDLGAAIIELMTRRAMEG